MPALGVLFIYSLEYSPYTVLYIQYHGLVSCSRAPPGLPLKMALCCIAVDARDRKIIHTKTPNCIEISGIVLLRVDYSTSLLVAS